ncbi:MAG TPA: hypothetical protein GXX51_03000 [Firmicutes bacterium]|nr:hypothetical protein [Bacillota bacterium]
MEEAVDWKAVALDEMEASIARGSSVREACIFACDRLKTRFGIDRRPSTLLSFYYKARKERSQDDGNDGVRVDAEITGNPCDAGSRVDSPTLSLVRPPEAGTRTDPTGGEGASMGDIMVSEWLLSEKTLMEFFTRVGRSLAELIKVRDAFEQCNARALALERENEALRRENEELTRKNSEMMERLALIQKTLGV